MATMIQDKSDDKEVTRRRQASSYVPRQSLTEIDCGIEDFLATTESERNSLKMHLSVVGICADRSFMQNQGFTATTSAHQ